MRHIEGCSVVFYNSFLREDQGEVDVVAIKTSDDRRRVVYLCEATTHIGGMNARTLEKLEDKLDRVRRFAELTFPGEDHRFQWWSPVVGGGAARDAVKTATETWAASGRQVEFVVNDEYTRRVVALVEHARRHPAATSEPAYRMLQILTHLRGDRPAL
jgi:hypothetical protein